LSAHDPTAAGLTGPVGTHPGTMAPGRARIDDVSAVLWPAPAVVSSAPRGRAVPGRERDFLLLPAAGRPRLVVPAGRRASAAAVRRYGEPGSLRAWAGTRLLALALAGGGARVGLGGRLRVDTPVGADTIETYLSAVLGHDVLVSTHLGAARANAKPVLQLLTADGRTAGFAKISVNALTQHLIRTERRALDMLAEADLRRLVVPEVLHHGQWQGRDVLVISALPVWLRRKPLPPDRLHAAMTEVAAVGSLCQEPLADSAYLRQLQARLAGCPASPDRDALDAAVAALTATGAHLGFGAWHGDWTGWNMGYTSAGLLVWDWERFSRPVPAGFDGLHYRLQSAVVRRQQPPPAAAAECVRAAAGALAPFGIAAAEARLTALLYLADLSVRYLTDRQAEAGARLGQPGTWLIPAIEKAVRSL
jgi:hypothetical protein